MIRFGEYSDSPGPTSCSSFQIEICCCLLCVTCNLEVYVWVCTWAQSISGIWIYMCLCILTNFLCVVFWPFKLTWCLKTWLHSASSESRASRTILHKIRQSKRNLISFTVLILNQFPIFPPVTVVLMVTIYHVDSSFFQFLIHQYRVHDESSPCMIV